MDLHEYQAKELLRKFGLPLLSGKFYENNLNNIDHDLSILNGPPWVVKSQIHAGGRGSGYFKSSVNNKGGVQIVKSKDEAKKVANAMLNNTLVTKQTGIEGKKVRRIFIEEGCEIQTEYYLSFLIDRKTSKLMMMISSSGGVDIEKVAETNPEKINNVFFPNLNSFNIEDKLKSLLNFNNDEFNQFKIIVEKLGKAFVKLDASTIEINPLVLNK